MMCHTLLRADEKLLCDTCLEDLPYTHFLGAEDTEVRRLFKGFLQVVRASSHLYYNAMTDSCRIFFAFKYYNQPKVAVLFGRRMAEELQQTAFFDDIDLVIPVPLHPQKEQDRGYNQSQRLAEGVRDVTGLPINTSAVVRTKNTVSQTGLNPEQRRENVRDAFALLHPEEVAGRHILLLDDVVTTNATLVSCASELLKAPDVRISILTLGFAGSHGVFPHNYVPWWAEALSRGQ